MALQNHVSACEPLPSDSTIRPKIKEKQHGIYISYGERMIHSTITMSSAPP